MIRNFFIILIIAGLAGVFVSLFWEFGASDTLTPLATHYANNGAAEVGAPNLVTSIVVTYRGLDTLGEVTILFLVAAIISFFLKVEKKGQKMAPPRVSSEIILTASKLLVPVVLVLGIYVFVNGHLTPGGGFQGGAIIATAFVLLLMANPRFELNHRIIAAVESVSGMAFVLVGVLGILLAGGFLDNKILPLGHFGKLFSAGAIPIIYSLVGLKVGSELSNILSNFQDVQKDEL
ncbi:MAG: Na(+)/H(+) antiporter subunit B [Paludibacteraceae bacterium]|nr:Na(+)/H(+) antiporter subunit B [Paludibacteraceae bacterium]